MDEQEQADLQQKCDEYLAGWKRALADYDNLQKDLGRMRTDMRVAVTESLVDSLLTVMTHFDEAMKQKPDGEWANGIAHIQKGLQNALAELGVEAIEPAGAVFDPTSHEAVAERAQEGTAPGSVVEVVSRGWRIGPKVVRPAKVILSSAS